MPFTLSTMSINSIEDVAEATTKPFWFQLYTMRDEDYVRRLIERAKAAKCSALVITLDLQILGQRHKDLKNGLSAPPKLTAKTIANLMTKWSWGLGMLGAKRRNFGNIVGHVDGISDAANLGAWTAEQFDPSLDWGKIAKIKELWGGPVILKGILDAEDARMALQVGADAIIVSNHAAANLMVRSRRSAPCPRSSMRLAIRSKCTSIPASARDRTSSRPLRWGQGNLHWPRLCLWPWGDGPKGVTTALEVLHKELDISMALCGRRRIEDLNRDILLIPEDFEGRWQD